MTTIVHLVRHATHGHFGRILSGRVPGVPLTEEGRAQARRLADRLVRDRIDAIETSPLERAQETAGIVGARLGLVPQVRPALNEIDFGPWAGQAFDDLEGDPSWRFWNAARGQARPPGGESMVEAQARIAAHLDHLKGERPGARILIVSHADLIKAALAFVLGLALDLIGRFEIGPASISTVALDPWGARVLTFNEATP